MKTLKKGISILLIFVMMLGLVALTGCGGENTDEELTGWAYIEDKGELIIGLDDTFAPCL